jgi:hypothetical protein
VPIALLTLLGLHYRGRVRHSLRGVRTPRGLVFLVLGIVVLSSWLGPALYRALRMPRADTQMVRIIAPFAILGFCLSNLFASFGENAIAFTGAEVDFLFPGPFTRRTLLGYKILKTALGTAITSLIFSVLLLRYSRSWIACFVGIWLTVQFMQLFAMAVTMVGQTIGERAYSGARRAVLIAAAALGIIAVVPALAANLHSKPLELLTRVHATIAGRVLLAPFDVFARTITARPPDLPNWATLALLIDLLMLAIVIGLDANYLETAAMVSQRRYERRQRARAGGMGGLTQAGGTRIRVVQLPWLGGAQLAGIAFPPAHHWDRRRRIRFSTAQRVDILAGKAAGRRRVDEHRIHLDAQVRFSRRAGPPGFASFVADPPGSGGGGGAVYPNAGPDHDAGGVAGGCDAFLQGSLAACGSRGGVRGAF